MNIVDYDRHAVPPRWSFRRVETLTGLVGWGDTVVEGPARTVRTAVEALLDTSLLRTDPFRGEDHWYDPVRRHPDGSVAEW